MNDDEIKKRLRIFELPNGFKILAGKSAADNDFLTFKVAGQNDLWFHVRGASGSHTVLKISDGEISNREKAPKDFIEAAASIAAFYSKAKNTTKINVAYTEVRNVSKYRGPNTGSVVVKNERLVKVTPSSPEEILKKILRLFKNR